MEEDEGEEEEEEEEGHRNRREEHSLPPAAEVPMTAPLLAQSFDRPRKHYLCASCLLLHR
jgi:hypothetical protein